MIVDALWIAILASYITVRYKLLPNKTFVSGGISNHLPPDHIYNLVLSIRTTSIIQFLNIGQHFLWLKVQLFDQVDNDPVICLMRDDKISLYRMV
jgi:hypothetical protein